MSHTMSATVLDSTVDLAPVDDIVERIGCGRESIIPLLQAIQSHYRYLPEPALRRLCAISDITPSGVYGVASFYSQFRWKPMGRHLINICHGTACHVKGAELVHDALRRRLGLTGEDDTDAGDAFTVQKVACLGCCTLAPVLQIDQVTYGHLTPTNVAQALDDFLELERRGVVADHGNTVESAAVGLAEIRIGMGSCCIAGGSADVCSTITETVRELNAPCVIKTVGCVGMCHQTPLVEVSLPGEDSAVYARVDVAAADRIVREHFRPKSLLRRLQVGLSSALDNLLTDEFWEPVTRYAIDVREAPVCDFVGRQKHIATEHSGKISPLDIDEYISHGGFQGLRHCLLDETPDSIINIVRRSGLRGRGGGGYPTGDKWFLVNRAESDVKYVICNGDEGDPGAFMDRMILESYPYRVLEGIAIAARAVGAKEAVLYIRSEYPLAVERIREAIVRCEERGFVGHSVLMTDFSLSMRIMEGAGAFVCGEETALLASIEGRRGSPRLRPPYPAEFGLWGKPTSVNNVETYALVPWIIRNGAEAFCSLGTKQSKGTKVFALAGQVRRGGLIEVPMGVTVREVVEEIGGGVTEGRIFKAVQIGGPSGGCIPARLADTAVDYESLKSVGAIMGSGGFVVMDDTDCMVDIARYFLEFTQRESCGKCTFCRVGTKRMLEILEKLCTGHASKGDIERLEELCAQVKGGSLCALGQTAPNPVLTTIKHFREEYNAHLEGRCPAGKCRGLITYTINKQCIGCTKCVQACPNDAIPLRPYEQHEIDSDRCIRCGTCREVCPVHAVEVT